MLLHPKHFLTNQLETTFVSADYQADAIVGNLRNIPRNITKQVVKHGTASIVDRLT